MRNRPRRSHGAFTLIELLVVVAIIALLISILLPSLANARESARAAKCGVILRGFGTGLTTYSSEENGWIPGANTSGLRTRFAAIDGDVEALRHPETPVQIYDWMTSVIKYNTELPFGRAKRWKFLQKLYRCPDFADVILDRFFPDGLSASPDSSDFAPEISEGFPASGYLMPAHFQYWGQGLKDTVFAIRYVSNRPFPVNPLVQGTGWSAVHLGNYRSRLDAVGPASRKIMVADGMRYLTREKEIDADPQPDARYFGAFSSNGGWWCGTQEYGVKQGSRNWNGRVVSAGSDNPEAGGEALAFSYRHNVTSGVSPLTAQDNNGSINAVFFDGHVARLNDRQSREIDLWYPSGTTVMDSSEAMIDMEEGFVLP